MKPAHVPLRNVSLCIHKLLGGREFLSGSTEGGEDAATHGVLC